MSLYSFLYGINPEWKDILKKIKVMGSNLNIEAPTFIQVSRFRDVWYLNGVVTVIARIGGVKKNEYIKTYREIEKNEFYLETVEYLPKDNYVLFKFEKEIDVKNYSLEGIIYIKGYEKNHQTNQQKELMESLIKKMKDGQTLSEYELKAIPYNFDYVYSKDGSIANFVDRENILEIVDATKDIRKRIAKIRK